MADDKIIKTLEEARKSLQEVLESKDSSKEERREAIRQLETTLKEVESYRLSKAEEEERKQKEISADEDPRVVKAIAELAEKLNNPALTPEAKTTAINNFAEALVSVVEGNITNPIDTRAIINSLGDKGITGKDIGTIRTTVRDKLDESRKENPNLHKVAKINENLIKSGLIEESPEHNKPPKQSLIDKAKAWRKRKQAEKVDKALKEFARYDDDKLTMSSGPGSFNELGLEGKRTLLNKVTKVFSENPIIMKDKKYDYLVDFANDWNKLSDDQKDSILQGQNAQGMSNIIVALVYETHKDSPREKLEEISTGISTGKYKSISELYEFEGLRPNPISPMVNPTLKRLHSEENVGREIGKKTLADEQKRATSSLDSYFKEKCGLTDPALIEGFKTTISENYPMVSLFLGKDITPEMSVYAISRGTHSDNKTLVTSMLDINKQDWQKRVGDAIKNYAKTGEASDLAELKSTIKEAETELYEKYKPLIQETKDKKLQKAAERYVSNVASDTSKKAWDKLDDVLLGADKEEVNIEKFKNETMSKPLSTLSLEERAKEAGRLHRNEQGLDLDKDVYIKDKSTRDFVENSQKIKKKLIKDAVLRAKGKNEFVTPNIVSLNLTYAYNDLKAQCEKNQSKEETKEALDKFVSKTSKIMNFSKIASDMTEQIQAFNDTIKGLITANPIEGNIVTELDIVDAVETTVKAESYNAYATEYEGKKKQDPNFPLTEFIGKVKALITIEKDQEKQKAQFELFSKTIKDKLGKGQEEHANEMIKAVQKSFIADRERELKANKKPYEKVLDNAFKTYLQDSEKAKKKETALEDFVTIAASTTMNGTTEDKIAAKKYLYKILEAEAKSRKQDGKQMPNTVSDIEDLVDNYKEVDPRVKQVRFQINRALDNLYESDKGPGELVADFTEAVYKGINSLEEKDRSAVYNYLRTELDDITNPPKGITQEDLINSVENYTTNKIRNSMRESGLLGLEANGGKTVSGKEEEYYDISSKAAKDGLDDIENDIKNFRKENPVASVKLTDQEKLKTSSPPKIGLFQRFRNWLQSSKEDKAAIEPSEKTITFSIEDRMFEKQSEIRQKFGGLTLHLDKNALNQAEVEKVMLEAVKMSLPDLTPQEEEKVNAIIHKDVSKIAKDKGSMVRVVDELSDRGENKITKPMKIAKREYDDVRPAIVSHTVGPRHNKERTRGGRIM